MNNGEMPASPFGTVHYTGLTKREMFAMAAMQGRAAIPATGFPPPGETGFVEMDAKMAVEYADALLAELAKPR